MAHWAEVDDNNVVLRVLVGDNNDPAGDEGYTWLLNNLGGKWLKTSYNGNIRKNYAGIGYTYDEALDAFVPPQPFASWTLNTETALWEAPFAYPVDGNVYVWNESVMAWEVLADGSAELS